MTNRRIRWAVLAVLGVLLFSFLTLCLSAGTQEVFSPAPAPSQGRLLSPSGQGVRVDLCSRTAERYILPSGARNASPLWLLFAAALVLFILAVRHLCRYWTVVPAARPPLWQVCLLTMQKQHGKK